MRETCASKTITQGYPLQAAIPEVQALVEESYAVFEADDLLSAASRLCGLAQAFFASPDLLKQEYHTDAGEGFRAFATEYTDEPDQPDLVECFSCSLARQSVRKQFPAGLGLALYDAMLDSQVLFARKVEWLANNILRSVGLQPPGSLAFDRWSRLQLNHADTTRGNRELLHVVHQDGNFLTLAFATAPGLNVVRRDGHLTQIWPASAGKWVVMAGEILTMATGGKIPPTFHSVERCPGIADRMALLYFADGEPESLARCTGIEVQTIRERVEAGWLRSGVAPVQPLGQISEEDAG